jgi:hypothetical protein
LVNEKINRLLEAWMTFSEPDSEAPAKNAIITDDELCVQLADGRRICVPLAWFPKLLEASKVERETWELLGDGLGICWPSLDEDLSVDGLLQGNSGSGKPEQAG